MRVTVLPRPMSSARQAPRPSSVCSVEPGQAVELVVAQRRVERSGRRDRLPGGGVQQPVADLQQARAHDDLFFLLLGHPDRSR